MTTEQQNEAERAILGAVLLDPKLYITASESVSADDFRYIYNKTLFEKMGELYIKTGTIDIVMLLENMPAAENDGERAKHKEYLIKLSERTRYGENSSTTRGGRAECLTCACRANRLTGSITRCT